MSLLNRSLSWLLVGTLVGVGAMFTTGDAIAQSSNIDPLEGLGSTDDDGAALFGDTSNPFELIHRAILAPSMTSEEYQQRQQREIGSEAESFRIRQQEALRQQQELESGQTSEDAIEGDLL